MIDKYLYDIANTEQDELLLEIPDNIHLNEILKKIYQLDINDRPHQYYLISKDDKYKIYCQKKRTFKKNLYRFVVKINE